MSKTVLLIFFALLFFVPVKAQVQADFSIPDKVCVNTPVTIANQSIGASSYVWNFCAANISDVPNATNLGNIGGALSLPVFIDYTFDNGNYYAFVTNNSPGGLVRLDFGNSLLNTPTATSLGNFGGLIPSGAEGIQLVKNNGNWYGIIVGGVAPNSRILRISFGASLNNSSPTATNWGNIGNLSFPVDLHLFQDGNTWYGITINSENNTLTRFNFTESFENVPTGVNFDIPGAFDYPTGIYTLKDNGQWYAFVVNESPRNNTPFLTRMDYGNSLLNTPVPVNLGNPQNVLARPRDITLFNYCNNVTAFAVNAEVSKNDLVRFDFGGNLLNTPTGKSLGNIGNLSFPHSISKVFREGANLYTFTTNVNNNSITRFRFEGCSTIPSSVVRNPPPITYTTPGTYNINLTIDEGLPTQQSVCKQIVVLPEAVPEFSFSRDVCDPFVVHFKNESTSFSSFTWDFGNGSTVSNSNSVAVTYNEFKSYTVQLRAELTNGCPKDIAKKVDVLLKRDSLIINRDSVVCGPGNFQLNAVQAFSYCWTPAAGLSNASIQNPVITTKIPATTYFLTATRPGTNILTNGNFSQGNTNFQSDYQHSPSSGVNEGVYAVRTMTPPWHPNFAACGDHTSGSGNMLLVNGSATQGAKVWAQTIEIQPNTNYAFSTWLVSLIGSNPAQLQFSINGVQLGQVFSASNATCRWEQFYAVWNSGNNSTANISIVNMNLNTGGNDFALDDISFAPFEMVRDSVQITIHETPEIDFTHTIPYCKSPQFTASASFEPSPVAAWSWTFGDQTTGFSSSVTHSYAKGGKYDVKLMATDDNGCKDSVTRIIALDTATAVVNTARIDICKGEDVAMNASGGVKYEWSPTALFSNTSAEIQQVKVDTTTKFLVKVTDVLECTDTASVFVYVKPAPLFTRPPARNVCADSSVVMLGANRSDYAYEWSPQAAFNDANSINPIARPVFSTQYSVKITEGECGYDTVFLVNVQVNPNPTVTASSSNDIDCRITTTFLEATGPAQNTYTWSPASGVTTPNAQRSYAGAKVNTYFVVKSTNQFECSAYDSVLVLATQTGEAMYPMPNAFTPNGDGFNDCISLSRWGDLDLIAFSIFTRWGEKVFSTTNPKQCWDGTFKGKPLPVGGYVYFVKARTLCGDIFRKGQVMLLR